MFIHFFITRLSIIYSTISRLTSRIITFIIRGIIGITISITLYKSNTDTIPHLQHSLPFCYYLHKKPYLLISDMTNFSSV